MVKGHKGCSEDRTLLTYIPDTRALVNSLWEIVFAWDFSAEGKKSTCLKSKENNKNIRCKFLI